MNTELTLTTQEFINTCIFLAVLILYLVLCFRCGLEKKKSEILHCWRCGSIAKVEPVHNKWFCPNCWEDLD